MAQPGMKQMMIKPVKGGPLAKPQQTYAAPPTIKCVVMDTHDGAFTDESVKIKPHKTDARKVVLKCTDPHRLAKAVAQMGVKACGPMIKGAKHYIVVAWKDSLQKALGGGGVQHKPALKPGAVSMVPYNAGKKSVVAK